MDDPIEIAIALTIVISVAGGMSMLAAVVRGLVKKWTALRPVEGDAMGSTERRLDELAADVAELQERVDFTERVLAQQAEPSRLADGRRE